MKVAIILPDDAKSISRFGRLWLACFEFESAFYSLSSSGGMNATAIFFIPNIRHTRIRFHEKFLTCKRKRPRIFHTQQHSRHTEKLLH